MAKNSPENYNEDDYYKHGYTFRKLLIFTGLEGILTMYSVLAASAGANLTPRQILSISLGCLLACSLSTGYNKFLSNKSENEYIEAQKNRETAELKSYPDVEKNQLFKIYTNKYNFEPDDAQSLVDISFKKQVSEIEIVMKARIISELN